MKTSLVKIDEKQEDEPEDCTEIDEYSSEEELNEECDTNENIVIIEQNDSTLNLNLNINNINETFIQKYTKMSDEADENNDNCKYILI